MTNTGHRNGAIRLLQCRLSRPLHWFIYYLHLNELPFRHLCVKLIGSSEGLAQWNGSIGKALSTCESLPLSTTGIRVIADGPPPPYVDLRDLNWDQAYLYKMMTAIIAGKQKITMFITDIILKLLCYNLLLFCVYYSSFACFSLYLQERLMKNSCNRNQDHCRKQDG